ncbi:MAG TPA: hypothetical protein PKH24_18575 [Sedimentisphaerales bacterium]|jgi:hypothetical protein|nr:hypothetical protein [Sedimentisphaerales bacterium]HNU31045.1 hypothetical protein [Sedimentisphaerales bacterium]
MEPLRIGSAELHSVIIDGAWRGFGRVTIAGHELRSPRLPWSVDIRTPEALEFTGWRVLRTVPTEGGIDLVLHYS